MTNKVLTAKYSLSIFFLCFLSSFFTFHGLDTVTKAMIWLISEIQLLTLLNAVHEMGLLTVFILQITLYIVSNHSLLIYNWIPKYILHLVHSLILMSASSD